MSTLLPHNHAMVTQLCIKRIQIPTHLAHTVDYAEIKNGLPADVRMGRQSFGTNTGTELIPTKASGGHKNHNTEHSASKTSETHNQGEPLKSK